MPPPSSVLPATSGIDGSGWGGGGDSMEEWRNEIGMTVWPSPEMKMGEASAYDRHWVGQMAELGSGA